MGKKSKKNGPPTKDLGSARGNDMPSFDEDALSALTARLEQDFVKGNSRGQTKVNTINGNRKGATDRHKEQSGGSKPGSKAPELAARGTKRDARGDAKLSGPRIKKPRPDSKSAAQNKNGENQDGQAILLAEIIALGGTEEDLELVADAISDDEDAEVGTQMAPDQSFQKDLAAFVAGLGIEGAAAAEDQSPPTKNGEPGEDLWEEASDISSLPGESESEPELELKKPATAKIPGALSTTTVDPNRLVSAFYARN
jgi:ribosome biogenesis protein MAK21